MASTDSDHSGERQPLLGEQGQDPDVGHGPALADVETQGTFSRNLGSRDAFAIIINIVIGSGIFTSPGSIDTNVPSPGVALVIWLVGGVLAWTGASTMAELGTAIPGEGGVQPYLQYIFGEAFGFLAAWTCVVVVMPVTLAILSIVFVENIFTSIGITDQANSLEHKLLAILIMIIMNIANSISTKASTRLNSFFVFTKFLSIAGVVMAGLAVVVLQLADPDRDIGGKDWFNRSWFAYRPTVGPDGTRIDWTGLSQWELLGHYSAAIYGALWACSGWDKAIYISAELSNPARQLPLAINTAVPTIVLCFLASNAGYYVLLPWSVVSTTDSVAVTAITGLLGPLFGVIAAILIGLVVAGSILGISFVAGRMTVAAANKDWLPRFLAFVGRVGFETRQDTTSDNSSDSSGKHKSDAPLNAIILATALSTLYILLGNFRDLLILNGLGEYSFFFLTVVGAIVLRFREPNLRRPYKPYLLSPLVFVAVSGFVVIRGAIFAPKIALVLVVSWVLGLGFYRARRYFVQREHKD